MKLNPINLMDPSGESWAGVWGEAIGGAAEGSEDGAAGGTVVEPGGGTILGGVVGGVLGGIIGGIAGGWISPAAPENIADSQIVKDYGEEAAKARCEGKEPPNKCDWLEENKSRYRPDQVKATQKAWGCRRSRAGR